MHDLIVQGKVLYWGTSEWSAAQITAAHAACRAARVACAGRRAAAIQPFPPVPGSKREYATLYRKFGLGTTIWSPLASGLLTGKYREGIPPGSRLAAPGLEWLRDIVSGPGAALRLAAIPKLAKIATELDTTLPRLGVAWCLKNPRVSTVILGASRVAQLQENLGAIEIVERSHSRGARFASTRFRARWRSKVDYLFSWGLS